MSEGGDGVQEGGAAKSRFAVTGSLPTACNGTPPHSPTPATVSTTDGRTHATTETAAQPPGAEGEQSVAQAPVVDGSSAGPPQSTAVALSGKEVASKAKNESESESESEDESEQGGSGDASGEDATAEASEAVVHTLNEVPEEQLPIKAVDFELEANEAVEPLGSVLSLVGRVLVVQARRGTQPLKEDSVLCFEDRRIVGRVAEVFGPVAQPFYTVRFTTPGELQKLGAAKGDAVFVVTRAADYLGKARLKVIRAQRGCDASDVNNEEPKTPMDFSDDEEERAFKRQRKRKRKGREGRDEAHNAKKPRSNTRREGRGVQRNAGADNGFGNMYNPLPRPPQHHHRGAYAPPPQAHLYPPPPLHHLPPPALGRGYLQMHNMGAPMYAAPHAAWAGPYGAPPPPQQRPPIARLPGLGEYTPAPAPHLHPQAHPPRGQRLTRKQYLAMIDKQHNSSHVRS